MKITIEAEPKEIAALVLAVQEQLEQNSKIINVRTNTADISEIIQWFQTKRPARRAQSDQNI